MPKWEYRVEKYSTGWFTSLPNYEKLQQSLNALGCEGWELVNTFDTNIGGNTGDVVAIFKRPVP